MVGFQVHTNLVTCDVIKKNVDKFSPNAQQIFR